MHCRITVSLKADIVTKSFCRVCLIVSSFYSSSCTTKFPATFPGEAENLLL